MPRAKPKKPAEPKQPEKASQETRELAAQLAADCYRSMGADKGAAAGKKLLALCLFFETYIHEGSAGLELALDVGREASPRWHA